MTSLRYFSVGYLYFLVVDFGAAGGTAVTTILVKIEVSASPKMYALFSLFDIIQFIVCVYDKM